MDIREYYKQAGAFHGHLCPGLAIGVRAACEAGQALGTQMADRHNHIQCLAESTACWLDGIQFVLGSTLGNGALKIDDTGKSAFSFYNPETGESLRYYLLELLEKFMDVAELADETATKVIFRGQIGLLAGAGAAPEGEKK